MSRWDLSRLTPSDFEELCRDLLCKLLNVHLESFPAGRDEGIDLRHMAPDQNYTLIVQCKHWLRSGSAKLMKHLVEDEKPKVEELDPQRYIVCTSVNLTPGNKTAIVRELSPWLKTTTDIYAGDDIEALLRDNEQVVRQHPRLWLASSSVLQAIVNNRIHQRSHALAMDTDQTLKIFVPHAGLKKAADLLASQHVCLLTGLPGVGKTTLAQVLAAQYAELGYEVIDVGSDIDEANAAWDPDSKQIFYYDDFLGQVSLGDSNLAKNEEHRIVNFMRRTQMSPTKRLILTTRGYILEHARQRYERLATANFDPMRCVIPLSNYTRPLRAQMVFNHVYFSGIDNETRECLADQRYYRPVVDHVNFNPRLIELSVRRVEQSGLVGHDAASLLAQLLTEPRDIWDFVIERHLEPTETVLLETLAVGMVIWTLPELKDAWASQCAVRGIPSDDRDFRDAVAAMDGSLISIGNLLGNVTITLVNPSLRDHVQARVRDDRAACASLLRGALFFEQLRLLEEALSISTSDVELRDELDRAVGRTIDGPPPARLPLFSQGSSVRVARVKDLLAWAATGSTAASGRIVSRLEAIRDSGSIDELAETAHDLNKCSFDFPERSDMIDSLAQAAISELRDNVNSIDELDWARAIISKVENFVDKRSVQSVEERLESLVEDGLRDLSSLDFDEDDLPSGAMELIAAATDHFPWLADRYQDVIASANDLASQADGPDPDAHYDEHRESQSRDSEDSSIDDLFASLRDF